MLEVWIDHLRRTLLSYEEPLLRLVSNALCKPRNHWPAQELIDRCLTTLTNAAVLDRRLKDLDGPGALLLSLIARSRQSHWPVGSLIEMLVTLGTVDGLAVVRSLLEAGLMYPSLFPVAPAAPANEPLAGKSRLKAFDTWLAQALPPIVFVPPAVLERAAGAGLLPECPGAMPLEVKQPQEADGLEWLLRLSIIWQQVAASPLRRTQQHDFFKRDLDRLQTDSLLNTLPTDSFVELPDRGMFTVALGLATGILDEKEGEVRAGSFPAAWSEGLPQALASLWSQLFWLQSWGPVQGWHVAETPGNPYPSAYLLALLLLGRLPEGSWASPAVLEDWLVERHPFWNAGTTGEAQKKRPKAKNETEAGLRGFLLGIAYPLRLLQVAKDEADRPVVRLSALGRWVFGYSQEAGDYPTFPQTLLVQPNLEILAYRQGLTPALIMMLTKFATWKGLGAACTLQLEPHSVYRALEASESYGSIVQTLERHGMKPVPAPVLDSLRTWSNKRERISVYPAAALFEFPGPVELAEALARGLPAIRLTDRLAIVANESAIDYRHFRLTGTRDYCLPPEKCVDVESDGVTLSIDLARSDLLLETEVQGLAAPLDRPAIQGRRLYRLTPTSLAAARQSGWQMSTLESWFLHRTGLPLSQAAELLFSAADLPPLELRRQMVLHTVSAMAADGLQQWPETRDFIQARLGPTALIVGEQHVEALRQRCQDLGLRLFQGEG